MNRLTATLAITGLALGGAANAQSFNVDINTTGGAGGGLPTAAFAGAAGQAGTWNAITTASSATIALLNLNGTASAVTFTRATNGVFGNNSHAGTTGDLDKLIDDVQVVQNNETLVYTFNNLAAGTYLLYTYAGRAGYSQPTRVTVTSSDGVNLQLVDGSDTNALVAGEAFAVHGKTVAAGGSLTVTIWNNTFGADADVAGFQLRKIDSARARIFVDTNTPTTSQTGLGWTTAFEDLQDGLRIPALAGGKHFEIWVGNGFYEPTAGTDRTASFVIPTDLRIYGGFDGTEATFAERGAPRTNPTYLSGAIGGGSNTDNSFTVVDASDTSFATIIDGFFITSGYGNQVSGNDGKGGGVKMINGNAYFYHCNFINNTASYAGAGVCSEGGAPTFLDCIFFNNNNNNGEGGGVYHEGGIADFWNCEFLGNYATGPGGGINLHDSDARIVNCLFSGNTTSFGGGGLYVTGAAAAATVTNCTFSLNGSSTVAGGVQVRSSAHIALANSILWDNTDSFSAAMENEQITIEGAGTTYTMQYTTVQGLSSYNGVGSNGLNPHFFNPTGNNGNAGDFDDDLSLTPISPAINAGSNSVLPNDFFDIDANGVTAEVLPIDLNGGLRRVVAAAVPNTGSGTSPVVDRGVYEYVPNCPGDTNGDGVVNFIDLNQVLSDYGVSGFGLEGDVNHDNTVNFLDLNIVLSTFGTQC